MANTFSDDLAEPYRGEVIGEVLADRMLTFFDRPTERHTVATRTQVDTETRARLRPALLALGVSLVELDESRAADLAFAARLQGLGWREAKIGLRDGIKPHLERYREFAANALEAFKPTDDIVAQRTYPLPAPAQ